MQRPGRYFFSGIGGSGMSSLAQILKARGHWVGGSDRSHDRKVNRRLFGKLQRQGIMLYPQNQGTLPAALDALVVSSAIEHESSEVQQAHAAGIPVQHRAGLLAGLFNASFGIGIAGTSGKTTVTGMVASILDAAGRDPSVINGGIIKQYATRQQIGNARNGTSELLVSEVDESDGSIVHFRPALGVITNISKDHKELEELMGLFQTFAANTARQLIINGDCRRSRGLHAKAVLTFGMQGDCDLVPDALDCSAAGSRFTLQGMPFSLKVPGRHNVANALAAAAVGRALAIPLGIISRGLAAFAGIKRRLDPVGSKDGITVIDDFAHNPDKIRASLATLREMGRRRIVIFQPHGYGPTRFLRKELARAFSDGMGSEDMLLFLKIYDAGGTADRSISSEDLLNDIAGPQLLHTPERDAAIAAVRSMAQAGDVIAILGARDDTLSAFARRVFRAVTR
jgi:UDP-N-acetylmuramate--alanine ligase